MALMQIMEEFFGVGVRLEKKRASVLFSQECCPSARKLHEENTLSARGNYVKQEF